MISRNQLTIRVRYDAPVREAQRTLRVLPLARAGQDVVRESWTVTPGADNEIELLDAWGNRQLHLRHRRIEAEVKFELHLETRTTNAPVLLRADERLGQYKLPSRAVDFGAELQSLGRAQRHLAPLQRAAYFCTFCHDELIYRARADARPPLASEAWRRRVGSCADFAHVFLSLCRSSGLGGALRRRLQSGAGPIARVGRGFGGRAVARPRSNAWPRALAWLRCCRRGPRFLRFGAARRLVSRRSARRTGTMVPHDGERRRRKLRPFRHQKRTFIAQVGHARCR